jgi:hypothetical protein
VEIYTSHVQSNSTIGKDYIFKPLTHLGVLPVCDLVMRASLILPAQTKKIEKRLECFGSNKRARNWCVFGQQNLGGDAICTNLDLAGNDSDQLMLRMRVGSSVRCKISLDLLHTANACVKFNLMGWME